MPPRTGRCLGPCTRFGRTVFVSLVRKEFVRVYEYLKVFLGLFGVSAPVRVNLPCLDVVCLLDLPVGRLFLNAQQFVQGVLIVLVNSGARHGGVKTGQQGQGSSAGKEGNG